MSFVLGVVFGIAFGLAIIVAFVKSENARSKQRTDLVSQLKSLPFCLLQFFGFLVIFHLWDFLYLCVSFLVGLYRLVELLHLLE